MLVQSLDRYSNTSASNISQKLLINSPMHFFAISHLLLPLWLCSCRLMYRSTASLRSAISLTDLLDFLDTIIITVFSVLLSTIAFTCGQTVVLTMFWSSSFTSFVKEVSICSCNRERRSISFTVFDSSTVSTFNR